MKILYTLTVLLFCSLTFAQTDSNQTNKAVTQTQTDTSIKTAKVEIINKSFDNLVAKLTEQKDKKNSMWDILIPLLIGAGLTLSTQFIIELWKTNKEKKRKKQELISRGRAKTYLIAQVLKDLAMYKAHKQYYIRAYQLYNDEDNYKKHYEKGQQQRETEAKLDDTVADYFQLVTEYAILTNNIDNFQKYFQIIFHYKHPKSSKFADCKTIDELVVGLEKEEDRLNVEYKKLSDIFEKIQTSLK